MELLDFYSLIAVLGTLSTVAMIGIFRLKPTKSAQKAGSDGVKEMYAVYNDQVKDVIKIKDAQIQRLMAKNRELEPIIEESGGKEPINLDSLSPLLQQRGINPELLKNPFISKLIKKYTKGMGLEEILAIVDQLGILKGIKKPENEINANVNGSINPNWA